MRANKSSEYIRELRSASTRALLPANISVYPKLLAAIDNVVLPLAEVTVWRKDYTFTLIHNFEKIGNIQLIKEQSIANWTSLPPPPKLKPFRLDSV